MADLPAPRRRWPRALALILLAAFAPTSAYGGDAATGRELAVRWCTSCHLVSASQEGASDIAPPFVQVANNAETTEKGLRNWLANPHPPMPNFNLGQYEVDHLIAYILSLRSN